MRDRNGAAAVIVLFLGCGGDEFPGDPLVEEQPLGALAPPAFGQPLGGLTRDQLARFTAGKTEFASEEDVEEGLGPVFNNTSCGGCHGQPAVGGVSAEFVTRFGRTADGVFDPLASRGGSLIQVKGIGAAGACTFAGETVPSEANTVARRMTTPLFGLGLVDAVPDATFEQIARLQSFLSRDIAGHPNHVTDLATGRTIVGKLGWKGQNPSLAQFSADAYLNEMGITSPLFPTENCPDGDCSKLACDPVADPEDDGEDVDAFTDFMTFLAPPPRGAMTSAASTGERRFSDAGCAGCHVPSLRTGSSPVAALDHKTFAPYSDFLLHDMGSLGDGIVQAQAGPRDMRTAPLWGLRSRKQLLHDGRATTVDAAIRAHEGQGRRARDRYAALPSSARAELLAFLGTL